jgi:hypothetical protein
MARAGDWTPDEDSKLADVVRSYGGTGRWHVRVTGHPTKTANWWM